MKYLFSLVFLFLLISTACQSDRTQQAEQHFLLLDKIVSHVEADLKPLETDISQLADFSAALFENSDSLVRLVNEDKFFTEENGFFYSKSDNEEGSTVFISLLAENISKSVREVYTTEMMDDAFKRITERRPMVSQVYFNASSNFSRLYPPYDLLNSIEPDIDVTAFNFFYLADEVHNPNRESVWIEEVYVDPVGRGWILSLVHPVYHANELKGVLGFDITLSDLMDSFLEKYDKKLMLIDSQGTVVAGKSEAIEALSLPPLKNHAYIQTINSDSFRREDFNLFKSKSKEVRRMASKFLLEKENYHGFEMAGRLFQAYCRKMNLMDWYLLDIHD
ncbi:Cache domain-containing protein [Cyclobacterium lianum]|uniref:Cache domain-containing protein n=1 Tax=Cyclobacterium lianum TaxID=388280 RepID=A0A1M7QR24_9BACT|nr:PDC sensor domain-containing protein [Cyclobacterium lianum]SHN33984.1 Cache domain-containing protein [Cyclobacterium lianum]